MIKISKNTAKSKKDRFRRKKRIRSNISGTIEKPRLSVFRSNSHIYVQLIDDTKGVTLAAASTNEEEFKGKSKRNVEGARVIGGLIAKRALAKNINKIVFDRSGYLYHGRVKALADAARESGLQF
jgi:large subunit ribosomal protein L18